MASLTSLRKRLHQERGAELIEMALVLPLLLLIVMGIIDMGFMFQKMNVVTNAAREGARAGILPDYEDDTDVAARVEDYLKSAGINVECPSADCVMASPTESVTPSVGAAYNARRVQVTIFHPWTFLSPIAALFGNNSFSSVALTGRAVMRLE